MITEMNSTKRLIEKYNREIDETRKQWEDLTIQSLDLNNHMIKLKRWIKELEEEVSS